MRSKKLKISGCKTHRNDSDNASPVNYFELYRYATKWDFILICIGIVCTIVKSVAMPVMLIIYSEFTTLLVDRTLGYGTSSPTIFLQIFGGGKILTNATWQESSRELINDGNSFGILVLIFTFVQLIAGIFAVDSFNKTALRQVTRIRINYFQSLMRQEIGWYDVFGGGDNFGVRTTEDIEKICNGIGEKVSHFLNLVMNFCISFVISFIFGWKLSLALVAYVPIVLITNTIIGKFQASSSIKEQNAYSAAANVSEEVLSGIRTVFAFGGENIEIERYNKRLIAAKRAVHIRNLLSGIGDGIMRFLYFSGYGLAFWYGIKLVLDDRHKENREYTPAVLMITTLSLLGGMENISRTPPFLEAFAAARASAATIFKIIDRASKIDSMSSDGKSTCLKIKGSISFKNVHFNYPSRPKTQILQGLDLEISAGESIAIVGHSGNGKSTCLQLLQRFYDPNDGKILIDGIDMRSININVLRSSIATVGQEPILFSTTIGENIRYGKPDATDEEVITAAQNSGAHDFIERLPNGYNTMVGEKGSQLSGGQKQRIAIARALIQNPKILLLDEVTSALDYQSEKFIQETLEKASKGRTTITVSHRISAIRSADRIVFIEKGIIVEDGTHNQLLAMKGRYHEMITAGNFNDDDLVDNKTAPENEIPKQFFNIEQNHIRELSIDAMERQPAVNSSGSESIQYGQVIVRIFKLARPEWLILFLASIVALLAGTTMPIYCILFAEVFGALGIADEVLAYEKATALSLNFLAIGVMLFVGLVVQSYWFSKTSINLVTRLRLNTFSAMLQQECGWFDEAEHSSAALSARLTADVGNLQGIFGYPLSLLLQTISAALLGFILSIHFSVKLALVSPIAFPISISLIIIESKLMSKTAIAEKESLEAGTSIGSEAITNIRTVASLRQETFMIERYMNEMFRVQDLMQEKLAWRGFVNSIAQSSFLFAGTAIFCYGARLIAAGEIHFQNVIKVSEMQNFSIILMCQSLIFAPTFTAAFVGAHRLFQIIDRKPLLKSPSVANKARKPDRSNDITYKEIDFRYPTRPDVQVLKDLNLKVFEGQTIALVGSSGCGKSTCIQLLQRLYDPDRGHIHLGFDEISSDICLKDLRSKLSIVSQEPVLFDKTIAENIAYGDTSRKVPMDEIIDAAKMANIHNYIVQLPKGYETNVGNKTAQLSGGQRQRIAIARALIRNPKLLLLDEATSSLDLQSEQIVQQALDRARHGRTCLIIAHRLSTVQNADVIYVLRGGNIVEHGNHSDLLALGGIYARLYNSQKSSKV